MMHKAWRSIEEVPYCFSRSSIKFHGHTGGKIDDLNPISDNLAGRSYQIPQICLVERKLTYFDYNYKWWCHQMETVSALLALVRGIHQSAADSPHKGHWALMLSLICAWTNCWANNRDVSDLRHHHAHYNVTAMKWLLYLWCCFSK